MSWDHSTDVLIMGSGAGGLTAALAAHDAGGEALVVEKGDHYGGSSAMSGGAVWVPCNRYMAERGLADDSESAVSYLRQVTEGEVDGERLGAYVDTAAEMVDWLHRRSHVRFAVLNGYPDYYAELEGGLPTGRTLGALPFDGRQLQAELKTLREAHPQTRIAGLQMLYHAHEAGPIVGARWRNRARAGWRAIKALARRPLALRHGRDPRLYMGEALVGRLRASLLDRNVPLWLESPIEELLVEHDRVVGAIVRRRNQRLRVQARRGLVMSAGGFGQSRELVAAHQHQPARAEWSAANVDNVGDAVVLGESLGAALEFMDSALWAPVMVVPNQEVAWMGIVCRCLPGSLVVDQTGRRFANEAAPFPEFGRRMVERGEAAAPAYLIANARYRRRYPMGAALPGLLQPDWLLPRPHSWAYPKKYRTLDALAADHGLDADQLRETVARFDAMARSGQDEDFGRGENRIDRIYGDPAAQPNPCLEPLGSGPYYVVHLYPGNLDTLGGVKADVYGQVLRTDGTVIAGLYATGNCASPLVGRSYPGSGMTIGPAMVFGYLAARHSLGVIGPD